ncbi:MAG: ABC transporter ATP-binding protein [Clostridia bacterium]|nr:MAG: ABC transporter ATP-binding protein [Clostridia bacterium]
MALIEIAELTYRYPGAGYPALQGVTVAVEAGEFVLLAGLSGSGKSTLLRAVTGLIPNFYGGEISGRVRLAGQDVWLARPDQVARLAGMVFQDPESQLVTPVVETEIAFGLQNMGWGREVVSRRVAEMLHFFALDSLRQAPVSQLSGGEKQKVALAAALAPHPSVLLADEPTSQLDPVAAEEILQLFKRINEENGLTILLVEQRLERCLHLADRVILMREGTVGQDGRPVEVLKNIRAWDGLVPPLPRVFASGGLSPLPLTVKEGRQWLARLGEAGAGSGSGDREETAPAQELELHHRRRRVSWFPRVNGLSPDASERRGDEGCQAEVRRPDGDAGAREPLVVVERLSFTYGNGKRVLEDISFSLSPGRVVAVMGANGAGKSTLVRHLNGLLRPTRGRVLVAGQDTGQVPVEVMAEVVGYLPQNPGDMLFQSTVRAEVEFTLRARDKKVEPDQVNRWLELVGLATRAESNPRDLGGGERQLAALAAVLAGDPRVLVLDEPTRGLDYQVKERVGNVLCTLAGEGKLVLLVSHDVEFVAEFAEAILFLSGGRLVAQGPKEEVLPEFFFFTPQVYRLFRGFVPGVLTVAKAEAELRRLVSRAAVPLPAVLAKR